jgi:hypothetical protein
MQTIIEQVPAAASFGRPERALGWHHEDASASEMEGDHAGHAWRFAPEAACHPRRRRRAFAEVRRHRWTGSKGAGRSGPGGHGLFSRSSSWWAGNFQAQLVRSLEHRCRNADHRQILDDINDSIQKYLFMMLSTNVLVGLAVWAVFAWVGLENAGAWAVAAGLLHVIPYLGPGVIAVATGMAAFMQFDSFPMALLVSGATMAIATVVGTFVTTWMTGRIARMNAAAIFISLLFWGWLWGIWGMLLSIPIIVIAKVVSEHVEQLAPLAELLGE